MADSRVRESILASERAFHDERYRGGDNRTAQLKYYFAVQAGAAEFEARIHRLSEGADVLEYGCGLETRVASLAPRARSFHGIDISELAVQRAATVSPAAHVRFEVMDAMNLAFADASFDLVYGSGIIHHLDTETAGREVARVLRPGGSAVFWEPLGYNPLINLYRRLTPSARTSDEHPLLVRDLDILRRQFKSVDISYFGLATIAAVPIRNWAIATPARNLLGRLDNALFRIPGLALLAWYALLTCKT